MKQIKMPLKYFLNDTKVTWLKNATKYEVRKYLKSLFHEYGLIGSYNFETNKQYTIIAFEVDENGLDEENFVKELQTRIDYLERLKSNTIVATVTYNSVTRQDDPILNDRIKQLQERIEHLTKIRDGEVVENYREFYIPLDYFIKKMKGKK